MKATLRIPRPVPLFIWLLVTFLVLFPKGGIKVGPVPFTWGYLVIGLTLIPALLLRLFAMPLRQPLSSFLAFTTLVPFQLVFAYTFFAYGVEDMAYFLSLFTSFFVLPIVFLLLYPSFLPLGGLQAFRRIFCFSILAAALFGIFLFFYHPLTGHLIEIPLLTVNAGDYGLLETTKHIDRGGFLKLISTYNNGNVYGVATLILFPLYLKLEPALWKRNAIRIALVLTLSRTVWIGLILEQTLTILAQLPTILARFPRIRPGRTASQAAALLATAALVAAGTLFFHASALAVLIDLQFGGRAAEFNSFANPTFLPEKPITSFAEVLYASALERMGITGFLAIVLIFAAPIVFFFAFPAIRRSPSRRAAAKGLILYAILAAADGATVWIPVMAFYWFAYMTMLYGLPGQRPALAPAPPPPSGAPVLYPFSVAQRRNLLVQVPIHLWAKCSKVNKKNGVS